MSEEILDAVRNDIVSIPYIRGMTNWSLWN